MDSLALTRGAFGSVLWRLAKVAASASFFVRSHAEEEVVRLADALPRWVMARRQELVQSTGEA